MSYIDPKFYVALTKQQSKMQNTKDNSFNSLQTKNLVVSEKQVFSGNSSILIPNEQENALVISSNGEELMIFDTKNQKVSAKGLASEEYVNLKLDNKDKKSADFGKVKDDLLDLQDDVDDLKEDMKDLSNEIKNIDVEFPKELKNLTQDEIVQVGNIDHVEINSFQWDLVGHLDQPLSKESDVKFNSVSVGKINFGEVPYITFSSDHPKLTLHSDVKVNGKVNGVDINHLEKDVDGFPDGLKNLTIDEIRQLEHIDDLKVSHGNWKAMSTMNQSVNTNDSVVFQNVDSLVYNVDVKDLQKQINELKKRLDELEKSE